MTSDFSLSIMEEDVAITITCNAISHGHYDDTLIKKDELTLTVLSKYTLISVLWGKSIKQLYSISFESCY